MRRLLTPISIIALLAAGAAAAGESLPESPPAARAMTDQDPSLMDAARTPLSDLNLRRKAIPEVVAAAVRNPYEEKGVESCAGVARELARLNLALGPDYDAAAEDEDGSGWPRITTGGIAKLGVESMIPFRGAVRYVSGATARDREVTRAIAAGAARRGFLRGLRKQMRCGAAPIVGPVQPLGIYPPAPELPWTSPQELDGLRPAGAVKSDLSRAGPILAGGASTPAETVGLRPRQAVSER